MKLIKYYSLLLTIALCLSVTACHQSAHQSAAKSNVSSSHTAAPQPSISQQQTLPVSTSAKVDKVDFDKLLHDLQDLHPGTAGSSLKIAATTVAWMNKLAVDSINDQELAKQFLLFARSLKQDAQKEFIRSWQLLRDFSDQVIKKDKTIQGLWEDAGVKLKEKLINSKAWQKLVRAIDAAVKELKIN